MTPRTVFDRLSAAVIAAAWLSSSCAPPALPVVTPPALPDAPADATLYLIGDAGDATRNDPLLKQLAAAVRDHGNDTDVAVVFLGDNVYPRGLRRPADGGHAQDVALLEAQIVVVEGSQAQAIFVPGNHDWDQDDGVAAIQRQGAYLASRASENLRVRLLPSGGCPGPASIELGSEARLIILDTEWWLRGPGPRVSEHCPSATRQGVLDSLDIVLGSSGPRHNVVLAHHPLETYGRHGGYFSLREIVFPLTSLWRPLYLPIPLVYPIVRNAVPSHQDMFNSRNAELRDSLSNLFARMPRRPLVYASGHGHSLQVFDGLAYGTRAVLVSGAGSRLSPVTQGPGLFVSGEQNGELGFMRIDFWDDGRSLLRVYTDGTRTRCADRSPCAQATLRYALWLVDAAPASGG